MQLCSRMLFQRHFHAANETRRLRTCRKFCTQATNVASLTVLRRSRKLVPLFRGHRHQERPDFSVTLLTAWKRYLAGTSAEMKGGCQEKISLFSAASLIVSSGGGSPRKIHPEIASGALCWRMRQATGIARTFRFVLVSHSAIRNIGGFRQLIETKR